MSKFIYLFWNKDGIWKPSSPEEMQKAINDWMKWMEELRSKGHLAQRGERLNGEGKVVRAKGKTVTDGPYAEAKDTIGGFMLVEAKDLDQAVELSKGCPIFDRGGFVEVRPVVNM
jgi:hypothetical protein